MANVCNVCIMHFGFLLFIAPFPLVDRAPRRVFLFPLQATKNPEAEKAPVKSSFHSKMRYYPLPSRKRTFYPMRGVRNFAFTPRSSPTGKFAQMTPLTDRGVLFVSRPGPTMPRIYPAPLIVTCFPHETFLSPISYSNCDEKNHRVTLRLEKAKVAVPPFLSVAPTDSTNIIRDSRTGEMVRVRFVN